MVARQQHLVGHPLGELRMRQREHLQRQRQRQQPRQHRAAAAHLADQPWQRDAGALGPRPEALGGPQLQRHAGEMLGQLAPAHPALAPRRVQDDRAAGVGLLQHDEVAQVPVQDAGPAQLHQLVDLQPQRARGQMLCRGHRHQGAQAQARHRHRMALAQRQQVGAHPEMAQHHGQAGQAALGRLGLQHHRHARAHRQRDAQAVDQQLRLARSGVLGVHVLSHAFTALAAVSSGSSIHSHSRRCSIIRSACTRRPGRSGALACAGKTCRSSRTVIA